MPRPSTTASMFALLRALRGATRPGEPSLSDRLNSLPRLAQATLSGRYTGTSRGRLATLAAAVLYVVSPVDLVPEAVLPFIGLADDAMVLSWLVSNLMGTTDDFLRWERSADGSAPGGKAEAPAAQSVVPGRVVR